MALTYIEHSFDTLLHRHQRDYRALSHGNAVNAKADFNAIIRAASSDHGALMNIIGTILRHGYMSAKDVRDMFLGNGNVHSALDRVIKLGEHVDNS